MSRLAPALDRQAVEVLLSALEAPGAALSAAALQGLPAEIGAQLIAAELIQREGHETIAISMADHEDDPVSLSWSADHRGYVYFSPTSGLVRVPDRDILRHRVNFSNVLVALSAKMQMSRQTTPLALVADHLWQIGKSRFGHRTNQTSILFGRRLHDASVWLSVRRTLEARPPPQRRLILTSTVPERLPEPPAGNVLISIRDLLGDSLTLEPMVVAARLDKLPVADSGSILLLGDGKEVRFFGETFRFPRGVRQRQIIRYIHERYEQGHLWTSTEEIVTDLELRRNARIRDFFKRSPAWNQLLTERNGMCGFCLPADAAEPD